MKAWLGLEEKEQSYMDLGGSTDAENPLTQAANSVAGAARTASISARRAVGMQVPVEEQTIEEQVCEMCPTMTFKQRLIALICCCVLGYILEICGTLTLIGGPTARNIRKFSVLYVCGNLIAIMATAFRASTSSTGANLAVWRILRHWDLALLRALKAPRPAG